MNRGLVLLYIKDGKNPLGSDWTILSDLRTVKGIKRRYREHMRRMYLRGATSYIIVPYYTWKNREVEDLIKNYPHYKLEV